MLTKAKNRMVGDAPRNVKDFGAIGDGVADDTDAIHAALGGAGATPDNTSIYFPNGDYLITSPIKVYRAGEILKGITIEGESAAGVKIINNLGKGIVLGEPDVLDLLWGSATSINVDGAVVRNLGHKTSDTGLWVVFSKNVFIDNIHGYDLVCVAVGNDATDACENIKIQNITRMNNGRDTSPDAWYSIGIFNTIRFSIDNYQSKFLPAAAGTGGNHIIISSSSIGTVSNCNIWQSEISGSGITLETGVQTTVVSNNTILGCSNGLQSFSLNNKYNLFVGNDVRSCKYGVNVISNNDIYASNYVSDSVTSDFYCANIDSTQNKFIGNYADIYSFPSTIEQYQWFSSNINAKRKIFVPASDFKQYLPAGTQETLNSTTIRLENAGGSIRAIATLNTGGIAGEISNINFIFDRKIASTPVHCYVNQPNSGGGNASVAQVLDTTAPLGVTTALAVFGTGSSTTVNTTTAVTALYIPTAAGVSDLIGVTFEFKETGYNSFVST
jgi:hypothetical protein